MKRQMNYGEFHDEEDEVAVLDGGEVVGSRQKQRTFVNWNMYLGHSHHVHYCCLFHQVLQCNYSHYLMEDGGHTLGHGRLVTAVDV